MKWYIRGCDECNLQGCIELEPCPECDGFGFTAEVLPSLLSLNNDIVTYPTKKAAQEAILEIE